MKAIRKGEEVKLVSNEEAVELVKQGWKYCGKYEWKRWLKEQQQDAPPAASRFEGKPH